MITSNKGVHNWARGSMTEYRALQKRILVLVFVKPVVEKMPTDEAAIDGLKREYDIPPKIENFCIVMKGFNYSPGIRGAILLKLFAIHFRNAKEIAPLDPTELVQEVPWQLPKCYRKPNL